MRKHKIEDLPGFSKRETRSGTLSLILSAIMWISGITYAWIQYGYQLPIILFIILFANNISQRIRR